MRVELTGNLSLSGEEHSLLTMHSVLNVMNTVMMELLRLSDEIGEHPAIERAEDLIMKVAEDLRSSERAVDQLSAADTLAEQLSAHIEDAVSSQPGAAERDVVKQSRDNLSAIFRILRIRAQELVERSRDPEAWLTYDIDELKHKFLEVLAAIEQNSHGGYRFVFNLASHEDGDYFVVFELSSFRGSVIRIPAVLQDVMRDLMANARKYTAPGGRIVAGLDENPHRLRFVIEDSGRGIPSSELHNVIEFGYRGSNVQDRPTRGGGFGLTKAFHVTQRIGGRMWIESEAEQGTRIEIEIPLAQDES